jgi:hypothetical protein
MVQTIKSNSPKKVAHIINSKAEKGSNAKTLPTVLTNTGKTASPYHWLKPGKLRAITVSISDRKMQAPE